MTEKCKKCIHNETNIANEPCVNCKNLLPSDALHYTCLPDHFESSEDMVNHPPHYCREGAMECFDEFVMIYGKVAGMYACLFNMHKYRYRSPDKGGDEDYLKSDWYVRKYKQLKEEWEEE